jgi:hypothetical protein
VNEGQRGAGIRGMQATTLIPVLGSDDADIVRASERQHAVEDMDRHLDFSRSMGAYARAQAVTDHLLPSPIAASTFARRL